MHLLIDASSFKVGITTENLVSVFFIYWPFLEYNMKEVIFPFKNKVAEKLIFTSLSSVPFDKLRAGLGGLRSWGTSQNGLNNSL